MRENPDKIKELIEFLNGYVTNDWDLLKKELKGIYTSIEIFSSISGTLEHESLSILDRVNWF